MPNSGEKGVVPVKALLHAPNNHLVYGPLERARLAQMVELDVYAGPNDKVALSKALRGKELLFTTWGMQSLDDAFLSEASDLKAVFYAAGSVRGFVTNAVWQRDLILCSAWAANAIPVAETSFALITLGLKRFFAHAASYSCPENKRHLHIPGLYGSTVGLIGLGMIGKRVRQMLNAIDVNVVAYDPYLPGEIARKLDVELVSLEDLFAHSDVVSLHAPNIPATRQMLKGFHFTKMKEGAVFINTARGALIDEPAMVEVLRQRPDIWAILDVTHPEPPEEGSPLFTLPNVILTPHIAGSMNNECRRMAQYMIDECQRYINGEPLIYRVTQKMMENMA
jgi:phosphoglycerate dehydrogenase-like enzyme